MDVAGALYLTLASFKEELAELKREVPYTEGDSVLSRSAPSWSGTHIVSNMLGI